MYSLPSHLSQSSRDLILRMLVVDPMKRISIGDIRQHQWFQHKLPAYLSIPPEVIELQEKYIDEEIVAKVGGVLSRRNLSVVSRFCELFYIVICFTFARFFNPGLCSYPGSHRCPLKKIPFLLTGSSYSAHT